MLPCAEEQRLSDFPAAKAGKAWKLPRVCVRASVANLLPGKSRVTRCHRG